MSDATIAQIQANIESNFENEKRIAQRADQFPSAPDMGTEEEDAQLDEAVATLDPIDQLRQQREQERIEEERIKFAQAQEERIIRLQQQAAKGNEQAKLELEKIKKQQAKEQGTIITTAVNAASDVQEQAFDTAEKVRDVANGAWQSVGRVAIPGSIWLPIAILLIFFFLLLPVNGMTRAQWLYLSLIGQAHIDTGISGGSGSGGVRTFTGVSNI